MTDLQTDTMTPKDESDLTNNTESDTTQVASVNSTTGRQIGRCKWFSKGYGFIQGLGNDTRDFFVHHTQLGNLNTSEETNTHEFRYLMRGETVEFIVKEKPRTAGSVQGTDDDPGENEDTSNRMMACNVTGIFGGPLMYQTELQEQGEHHARYASSKGSQTRDADQEDDFMSVSHRRHNRNKNRFGGKGRIPSHRWSTGNPGRYQEKHVPMPPQQMGYYGYYGQAPPVPNYGQLHQGFGMQHVPAQAPPGQQPATTGYNNGFSALEE